MGHPRKVIHRVKSWPEFFEPLANGIKSFELRRNDRDYAVGDVLVLREYEPRADKFTGRECIKRVTHILHGVGHIGAIAPLRGLMHGYVILGLVDYDMQDGPPQAA